MVDRCPLNLFDKIKVYHMRRDHTIFEPQHNQCPDGLLSHTLDMRYDYTEMHTQHSCKE